MNKENEFVLKIRQKLFEVKDDKYADFQSKLTPEKPRESFIGVKTPLLKGLAKQIYKTTNKSEINEFLKSVPHEYFEENNLHDFLICEIKDFNECLEKVNEFLPYIDNWATCDQLTPAALKKDKEGLLKAIDGWLKSDKTFAVRFGIGMLMRHFLGEDFLPEYAERVADIKSEEYYILMMQSWYFATALCKNESQILPYFTNGKLSGFVLKKSIQKSLESFRVTEQTKDYLRQIRKSL